MGRRRRTDQLYRTTYIHTHTYPYPYTKKKAFRGIYIYIYISLYIYLLIGTTILYSNIIKKEKNKEHTIILSRRSTLSSVHSIPSEQLLGIYLLFGTKKEGWRGICHDDWNKKEQTNDIDISLIIF